MDRKNLIYLSAIALLLILAGVWYVYGISTSDYTITIPLNNSANNSNNNTQQFTFKYINDTNASAICTVYYDSVAVASNSSTKNGTTTILYSNTSLGSDGIHTWYVGCTNGTISNSLVYNFVLDTTLPISPTLNFPTPEYNSSTTAVNINISGFDNLGDYFNLKMINFTIGLNGSNNKTLYTWANYTLVGFNQNYADGLYQWNVTMRDNASNVVQSTSNYFRVDTTTPTLGGYVVDNVTSGNDYIARINYTSIDAQLPIYKVFAYIYYTNSSNTTSVSTNVKSVVVYGTLIQNTTGLSIMNQINFAGTDVPNDGVFIIEPHANDTNNNEVIGTNQTNWTKTTLYTGWNMIGIDRNTTMQNVSQWSGSQITKVSIWNNSVGTWTNYVSGAATNAQQPLMDGDSVYVYATSKTYLMRKWSVDNGLIMNMSYIAGWNQMALWNTTIQLYQVCTQLVPSNATAISLRAVSYYDASVSTYYSQNCDITTGWNNNYTILKGKSVWFNLNISSSLPIYR